MVCKSAFNARNTRMCKGCCGVGDGVELCVSPPLELLLPVSGSDESFAEHATRIH
eukprot:CAMPEP_0118950238 /NCGR_PEP_ID=MMETSP1169-20130426/51026_1 /TAXON_ID=36882 /ORGANISM="Pyramimonas obovata, Strain CCMP722" /LENGTH=54 /DNA_ID=CAMNT_0006897027 /DNA_START=134 /DNA_END=295 /DNA_ORIENTATION=+